MADVRCSIERDGSRIVVAIRHPKAGGFTLEGSAAAIAALSASLVAAVTSDGDATFSFLVAGDLTLTQAPT